MLYGADRFGVVTRAALLSAGVVDRQIRELVRRGELRRDRPGIYVAGERPEHLVDRWHQRCAVALAAAGPGAALGGETAAHLWSFDGFDQFEFSGGRGPEPPVIVHLPAGSGRRLVGLRRSPPLEPAEHRHGLPVTSAGQTLLDLGYRLDRQRVRGACGRSGGWLTPADRVELATESALRRSHTTEAQLIALIEATPPRRGGRQVLHQVLRRRPCGAPATESYLETRGIQVLRSAGLPTGPRQVEIRDDGAYVGRVDLLLGERVVVEFDGRAFHDLDPATFSGDRRRWTKLEQLGYLVAIFTFEDVEYRPDVVAGQVRALLARA